VLRILVKNQLWRTKVAPVYDLEFDSALNAAIKLIDDPNYPRLLAEARSVRDLVEAKKAADPKAQAGVKKTTAAPAGEKSPLPAPEPKN